MKVQDQSLDLVAGEISDTFAIFANISTKLIFRWLEKLLGISYLIHINKIRKCTPEFIVILKQQNNGSFKQI